MIQKGSGHIVNIASINGLAPMPFNGPYNAAKFAVVGYTETLRNELAHCGIGVTVVCPGLTKTNIAKDRRSGSETDKTLEILNAFSERMAQRGLDPMRVARQIPPAIQKNRAMILPTYDAVLAYFLHKHLHSLYERLCNLIAKRHS